MKRLFITSLLSLCVPLVLLAQVKDEREKRVNRSELPVAAQKFIEFLPKASKKVRYYRETDDSTTSFEIKFKYKKRHHSVEFDTNGVLQDIEITIRFKSINKKVKSRIQTFFEKEFKKTKVIKTQKQFIFSGNGNVRLFLNRVMEQKARNTSNYEIIAEVKASDKRQVIEITFDPQGNFLNQRTLSPTSYEHILY